MKGYFYLGGAIGALALIIGAFFYGVSVGKDREATAVQKQLDRAAAAAARLTKAAAEIDEAAARRDGERRTIFREIYNEVPTIVDRPVYRNVCVDDAGVRLLDRAVDAANGELATVGRADGAAGDVRQAADHD